MGVAPHQQVRLLSRGVLRLAGADTLRFLQGLVTVDVNRLCPDGGAPGARALYGAFLNRRGRVAHAGFLVAGGTPDEVLLDAPAARVSALRDHLARHRLRARVDIDDVSAELAVVASQSATADPAFFADPRLPALGERAVVPSADAPPANPSVEALLEQWRVLCAVPDGADLDNEPLPLHLGLDLLNAVAFDKGCYLGQELTARTHFTGVLRKRLAPVVVGDEEEVRQALAHGVAPDVVQAHAFNDDEAERIAPGIVLRKKDDKVAGTVTSTAGNVGLAVVKLQDAFGDGGEIGKSLWLEDGRCAVPWRPLWWVDEGMRTSAA